MKLSILFTSVVVSATMAACGGGGGGDSAQPVPVADAIEKYVGTWVACAPGAGSTSVKEELAFTKASAVSANLTFTQTSHAGTSCAGNSTNITLTSTSIVSLAGTKLIGVSTVDKVNVKAVNPAGDDEKDIFVIDNDKLKAGDDTMIDTDGYPKALDTVYVYIKQASASAAPLTGYSGTWVGACRQERSISIGGAFAYALPTVNVESVSATDVSGSISKKIFSNANCTGTPQATDGRNFAFTIDGTTVIDGRTVDKITQTLQAIDSRMTSAETTVNGVTYRANYFTRVDTFKDLSIVVGNQWFTGFGAGSATVYPTVLQTIVAVTRQ